jgi:hypothetical protein
MRNCLWAGLVVGMTVTACGNKAADTASSASASAATSSKPASSGEAKKTDDEKPVTVASLTTDGPVEACKTLVACKNEEISVSAGTMLMMVAGFASMGDQDAQKAFKAIDEEMKKDKRFAMNADECGKVMAIFMKTEGATADKIQASIDAKKAEFDPKKASECLASLAKEPPSCATEKKVDKEPNLGSIDKMMAPYQKELDAYTKPCEHAIIGKVAEGGECAYDFECAGGKASCKQKKCSKKGD